MENHNLKVGDRMRAKVKTVISSGVFLNIAKNKDGYLHISELSSNRVENINDHVKVGDEFDVEIIKNRSWNWKDQIKKFEQKQ